MIWKTILFDLDGTLTDPGLGITNSVAYALKKFHINTEDKTALYKFIGPPLKDAFEQFYHFTPEESKKAVEYYREYFREKGIFENELYPGIPKLLSDLKKAKKTLIVATSKPEEFAVKILKYFDIYPYFDFVAGSCMDGSRSKKAEVIAYALSSCHIQDLSTAVMVGDREHDMIGAAEVGIDSVGVLYGYGSLEELKTAKATRIASDTEELASVFGDINSIPDLNKKMNQKNLFPHTIGE